MSAPTDPLVAALRALGERGETVAADRELGRILDEEAGPLLWRTIRGQLPELPHAEQEEVHGDAMLRLTYSLQRAMAGDDAFRIENLRAYVAATAANGCRAHLRARHPERTRLQNQLRYALRHDAAFASWEGGDGSTLWGLASWRRSAGAAPPPAPPRDPRGAAFSSALPIAASGELPALLKRYFLWRGGPVAFAELTGALAETLGVRDLPPVSLTAPAEVGEEEGAPLELAEERPGVLRELEDRQFLERLWREVRDLPRAQRVALLLNLRDGQGRDRLRLFPVTGVAGRPELARALELPLPELQELWERLPLEDRAIAELLGQTQRQVINLRKSARARLGRRLAGPPGPAAPPSRPVAPGGR